MIDPREFVAWIYLVDGLTVLAFGLYTMYGNLINTENFIWGIMIFGIGLAALGIGVGILEGRITRLQLERLEHKIDKK